MREKVPLGSIEKVGDFGNLFRIDNVEGYPDHRNPLFSAIISRNLGEDTNFPSKVAQILDALDRPEVSQRAEDRPDLMVLGPDIVVIAQTPTNQSRPFLLPGSEEEPNRSPWKSCVYSVPGEAFALGFCLLMEALDWIRLGKMPWPMIIGNTVNQYRE